MDKTIISKMLGIDLQIIHVADDLVEIQLVDKNINKVIESMTISEDWLGHLHSLIDVYFMNKHKENK
tara:strand:- start:952 stop:1152 length:201 start_codon:yes stop_codon:yes gene_type:complete